MADRAWRGFRLKANHRCERPSLFLFVDTESEQRQKGETKPYTEHRLQLGVCCAVEWRQGREPKETWHRFTVAEEFWRVLSAMQRPKRRVWVVAHNAIFDFTLLGLWTRLESGEYSVAKPVRQDVRGDKGAAGSRNSRSAKLCIDGIPFHIQARGVVGGVNFSDLMNYYNCKLEEVGKSYGIHKQRIPLGEESTDAMFEYCERDCQIVKSAYLGLVREWAESDNGNWQFSAPGLAWSHFRHKHDPEAIRVHGHAKARQLEWAAYYGGECRAFRAGIVGNPVVCFDVNSLYPSVMAGRQYPCELLYYTENPDIGVVERLLGNYGLIGEVTIESESDTYPCRYQGRVKYPVGRYRTAIAGAEFDRAIRSGQCREVHSLSVYKLATIFGRYVDNWWERKKDADAAGDSARRSFCKLMLNSLYGKFAQRSPTWVDDKSVDVVKPWRVWPHADKSTGSVTPARSIGWTGQLAGMRVDCQHTFPAIPAFVTAYGRERMREIRRSFPSGSVHYQDTDSIYVDWQLGLHYMLRGGDFGVELGQLRVVSTANQMTIRGQKNYTLDDTHCISGVRTRDVSTGDMSWSCERFERTASLVGRDPDETIRSFHVTQTTPGSVNEGGYDTEGYYFPLRLP